MIRAMIIDDERLARQELRSLVEQMEGVQLVAESGKPEEALNLIDRENPDLIFLDIQMPGLTGFELLDEIEGKAPEVIFVTAYDEYALKAFEVNALDYLMKPVEEQRLKDAVKKVTAKIEERK
jgi:two-component system LytT family response regulator